MKNKLKTILIYGSIFSLAVILMSVIAYVFDLSESKAFGWVSVLVFIAALVFMQKTYRDNYYNGFASYGKLYGGTVLMMVVASIIIYIYTYVFYKVIAPEQIDKMLEVARANLYENDQLSSEQINQSYQFMTKYVFTPMAMSLTGMITTFLEGLVFSLITCIFIKKKQDGFTEAMQGIGETETDTDE
mgnify:FL=1